MWSTVQQEEKFATARHTMAKRCYQTFLNNYLALAQGKLTKVSLKVFLLCILKSFAIVTKQRQKTDNLKEKCYMPKTMKLNLLTCLKTLKSV